MYKLTYSKRTIKDVFKPIHFLKVILKIILNIVKFRYTFSVRRFLCFFIVTPFCCDMPLIAKGLFYYTKTFLRLHMTKFLLGTIATLLLTLSFFIYKHNKTLQDLEHEKYKNLSLESKLQDSNNALEKIQLDTQSYLKGRDKEIQQIQNKYTKLLQEHTRQERALQQANTHSLHTQKHATQNHISSQVKLDNSYNATDTSKKSVSKHSLHTQNRDVSDITYPQHDTKDQNMRSRHSEGVRSTTEESTTESKIKGLDYSHSKDMTKNIRCFANAQHDVLNILRFLDVSLTQDVSAMPQHDKKHFGFLNKSNSIHNDTQHNLSYSEIPNNSNSNSNSFQNGNNQYQNMQEHNADSILYELQQCELQIQTAKTMLQQALQ